MMRRGVLLLALCALAAGCDDDNSTAPSAQPLVFSAVLSPSNEVPPVGNAESSGRGAVQVTFDIARNTGGSISSATATFHVQLTGFPGSTTMVGAHIHPGVAGVNGPVVVSTGVTAAAAVPLTDGNAVLNVSGINVDPVLAEAIANNPSAYYFNVHSPLNPGGFARGQLARVQ